MSSLRTFTVHIAVLTSVWAVLTLANLGTTSLWDADEGLNAEAGREMLESGNWIVPTFNFKPRNAKPALLYWLQAFTFQKFGVNEFAARLPSALAALTAVWLTYLLGRKMFDASTGLFAGIILASSIQFCLLAHAATPDMLLLVGILAAMYAFWIGYQYDRRSWPLLTAFGTALAVLAKGPVGLLMPTAIIGCFLLLRGELKRFIGWRSFLGVALFLILALPWYVLVGSETRGAFLRGFWWNENVNRFIEPLDTHSGPIYFYPLVLIIGLAPWSTFLVATSWQTCKDIGDQAIPQRLELRLLAIWIGCYLAFFSVAATKLPNYILPTYPAFAILTAQLLQRWQRGELSLPAWVMPTSVGGLINVGWITAAGCLIAGGIIPMHMRGVAEFPGLGKWAVIGVLAVAGGVVGLWFLWRRSIAISRNVVVFTCVAYTALIITFPVWHVESFKACRELIASAGLPIDDREIRIASYRYFQPSLVFYAGREITHFNQARDVVEHLKSPLPAYLICTAESWNDVAKQVHHAYSLVAQQYDFYHRTNVVVVLNR